MLACGVGDFYTKSSLLLDFKRGAQCVPPVCFGVLLRSAGQGASKQTSVHTAETAVPPFFCAAKSNFKETMVLLVPFANGMRVDPYPCELTHSPRRTIPR